MRLRVVWRHEPPEARAAINSLLRDIFIPIVSKVGWDSKDGEGELQPMLRSLAIGAAGVAGDETVLFEAGLRFEQYTLSNGERGIDADLRGAVFEMLLVHRPESSLEQLLSLYRRKEDAGLRIDILECLASVEISHLHTVLEFILSKDVRPQDLIFVFRETSVAADAMWTWLMEHWDELVQLYSATPTMLGRILESAVSSLIRGEDEDVVKAFFETKDMGKLNSNLNFGLDKLRANVSWLKRDRAAVCGWLMSYQKNQE